ncbi:MAG TPA: SCO family protein [Steroidobacteraceae bacterium]|nr:SCO family protein [Steroidobacteraceae bacterium]
MNRSVRALLLIALCLPAVAAPAANDRDPRGFTGSVDFAQHLGSSLPAALRLRDERGDAVRLGDYLGANPLLLVFAYYHCSNVCPMQIRNLAVRLAQAPGAAATRAEIIVMSVDPLDTPALAAQAKGKYLASVLPPGRIERWHFLSGAADDIARLTEAVGFRYGYDPASHQYAHPAGFALITPRGTIARYFFGFDFTAGELARALDEAAAQRIASPVERLLLVCFHYDPASSPYGALIIATLRAASLASILGVLALALIRVRRGRSPPKAAPSS